jgi:hypothetical protein
VAAHAGLLVQRSEVFNAISYRYGLDYFEKKTLHRTPFLKFSNRLLITGIPFMTSISIGSLPAPIYKKIKKGKSSPPRHAVVITQFDNHGYYGLDPDAGLDRTKRYEFNETEHLVGFVLDSSELKNGLREGRNNLFLLGYLQASSTSEPPDMEALVEASSGAVEVFLDRANRVIECLTDQLNYDEFSRLVAAYIKPIALDLRIAIEILEMQSGTKTQMAPLLRQLQDKTISIQKALQYGKLRKGTKIKSLEKLILNTVEAMHQHIASFSP